MKQLAFLAICGTAFTLYACGGNTETNTKTPAPTDEMANYDTLLGVGEFTNVQIAPKLNNKLATAGQKIYDVKCSACHKLTSEKLVGPGWKDVTKRFSAAWILNYITNTEEMLKVDPRAKELVAEYMVSMPNQNLSKEEALQVYEFIRKNDGVK